MATEKRLIERIAERLKDAYPQADRNNLCPAIYYDDFVEIVDDVLSEIGESVDAVEMVHGRWEWKDGCFHCSNCKTSNDHTPKYCEGCGAKMDGDGNG